MPCQVEMQLYLHPTQVTDGFEIGINLLVADDRDIVIVLLRNINSPGEKDGEKLNPGLPSSLLDVKQTIILTEILRG